MALADPKKAKGIHILSDGTVLDSIEGHIPKFKDEDREVLARIFVNINRRRAERARMEKKLH